jgi:hypothetical protein
LKYSCSPPAELDDAVTTELNNAVKKCFAALAMQHGDMEITMIIQQLQRLHVQGFRQVTGRFVGDDDCMPLEKSLGQLEQLQLTQWGCPDFVDRSIGVTP